MAPLGDLWHSIETRNGLDEHDLKVLLKQVVPALEFMHSKDLVHRDVRAENILLFKADFTKVLFYVIYSLINEFFFKIT